jgi:ribosomal protein S18 acetylase RimI-like enzyme
MNNGFSIALTALPDPADLQALHRGLEGYNNAKEAPNDSTPLALIVRDPHGSVVGGLDGCTCWGWLHISALWINKRLRGQGFGKRLLAEAEHEARQRGCRHVYLEIHDFQAVSFFRQQGYILTAEFKDFPPGHRRNILTKEL